MSYEQGSSSSEIDIDERQNNGLGMNNMLHTIKEQEDNSNIDVEERNN
jgi:hypothetical protein